jgi:lipoate-protein ligase A
LGKFQKPEADLIDFTRIPWVIRPTGGKAVLHGHDLTIAIACPVTANSVRAVYRRLIGPLAQGMQIAGQAAVLGEETSFVGHGKTADCFRNVSANDIVDPATGRKLVGCALKVTRTAALAQCSIPLGTPLVDPANIYRHPHTAMPLDIAESSLVKGITEAFTRIEVAAGGS